MIAFEIQLNGKRVCLAGADDLGVLTTIVKVTGKLGVKTVPLRPDETSADAFYSIGGLTCRADPDKDVHVRWVSGTPLKVGDTIQVVVVDVSKADRPKSRKRANPKHA
jgi:hypothetical protein